MTKFVDSLGLKRLVTKIAEAVSDGTWLPVRKGRDSDGNVVEGAVEEGSSVVACGRNSHAEGSSTNAYGNASHSEGLSTNANGNASHSEGVESEANGNASHSEGHGTAAGGNSSHAEGYQTTASGDFSHAEGAGTTASGNCCHAEGCNNYDDTSFIHMIGVGVVGHTPIKKNAVTVYVGLDQSNNIDPTNPKNGYQYLLDVGGYKGQAVTDGMKSVQEVITDLEKGVKEASETMTVEDIREIMSA